VSGKHLIDSNFKTFQNILKKIAKSFHEKTYAITHDTSLKNLSACFPEPLYQDVQKRCD